MVMNEYRDVVEISTGSQEANGYISFLLCVRWGHVSSLELAMVGKRWLLQIMALIFASQVLNIY